MGLRYTFDEDSYDALLAAGVSWQTVMYVLREARPTLRRHIGSVLLVAGIATDGRVIGISLIENDVDDEYLIVGVRVLDGDEREAVEKLLKGGRP